MRCRSCGSEVVQVRGLTGRLTICSRCGWGKVELTERRRLLRAVPADGLGDGEYKGWRAVGS
jgi:hypothetical protein